MRIFSKLTAILIFLVVFSSCYKDVSSTYDQMDATITMYDKAFSERTDTNFQTYKTFIIRDSVGLLSDYISEGDADWTNFYKSGGASDNIRQAYRKVFIEKGYVQVDSLKDADFGVNLTVTLIQNTGYVGYPGYWYGYGGYYPGWGWGYYWKSAPQNKSTEYYYGGWGWSGGYYPWYGGGYSYSYEVGTIMAEMIDAESLRDYYDFIEGKTEDEIADIPQEDFPLIYYRWQSFINGVISYENTYDADRFNRGIDEAFAQSPYIYSSNN